MDRPDVTGTAGLPPDWLQARVCDLRRRTRRRVFATDLGLVAAGAGDVRLLAGQDLPVGEPLDHALRVDLLVTLLNGVAAPGAGRLALVLTRSGPEPVDDSDLGWHAAWTVASGILGRAAGTTCVVTRYGYADVMAGSWVRVEPRRHRR